MNKAIVLALTLILSLILVQAGEESTLQDGLVEYWNMDKSWGHQPGTNGIQLVRFGEPTFIPKCINNGCYQVQGTGHNGWEAKSFSTRKPLPGLYNAQDVCVSMWGKFNATRGDRLWLFTLMAYYRLNYELSGQISNKGIYLYDNAVLNTDRYTTSNVNLTSGWHHYLFCETPKSGKFLVYVDGVKKLEEISGKDLSTPSPEYNASIFSLVGNEPNGRFNFGSPEPQVIDEIGIWNRMLTEDEINQLQTTNPFGKKYDPNADSNGGGNGGGPPAGVPEFTPLTLSVAIVMAGLGIVILRRQH